MHARRSRTAGTVHGELARPRALGRRLALAAASAALALAAAELVARGAYRAPWYEQLVAEQGASLELEYERNSYNLRGPDHLHPKAAGTLRVLMIGDSFTFGMGVARDEDIFPRRLERRLNEELPRPDVERVELLNGSIIGSLTGHWTEVWDVMKTRFEPDVLVLVFFLRDGTLAGSIPEFFDVVRDEVAARNRASALYRHSYLFRFQRDARDRERIQRNYTRLFRDAYFGGPEDTLEWQAAQRNVARMAREARALGCPVGFVVFPILAGLDEARYPFEDVCELLEEFGRESGMETFSLLPAFRGMRGPELWVSPHDQHPNACAHAIAAEALEPFLARLLARRAQERGLSAGELPESR